jgi:2,5-dioxopentanoate dehydrogenase
VPIPVYAEMSSVNPVVLMPARLAEAAEALAAAYVGSLSLGAGQFCTNPGIVLAVESEATGRFIAAVGEALNAIPAQTMLTAGIQSAYAEGIAARAAHGAALVGAGADGAAAGGRAHVFTVSGVDLRANPALVAAILEGMEGQLTATLHMAPADYEAARALLPILECRPDGSSPTPGPPASRSPTRWSTAAPSPRPPTGAAPRSARSRSTASCAP